MSKQVMRKFIRQKWLQTYVFDLKHPNRVVFCYCASFQSFADSFSSEWVFLNLPMSKGLQFSWSGCFINVKSWFWSMIKALRFCICDCWQGKGFEWRGFFSFPIMTAWWFLLLKVGEEWLFEDLLCQRVFVGSFGREYTWSWDFLRGFLMGIPWSKCLWLIKIFLVTEDVFPYWSVSVKVLLLIFGFLQVSVGHFI